MKPLYIEAVSLFLQEVSESSNDLKKELEHTSGQKFRRVNHFSLLALAGIFRIPNLSTIDPMSSLYLGTANGCVRDTLKMLEQMYQDALLPMPFTFMGTSTNMAGFHIAQTLGLQGANLTLSNLKDPFSQALALASMDIMMAKSSSALVGCVDEGVFPLDAFKRAIQRNENDALVEGGCWLKLTHTCEKPLAIISAQESFTTYKEVEHFLSEEKLCEPISILREKPSSYIGSSLGIDYVRALQEQQKGTLALVSQSGKNHFLVTITRLLG